MRKPTLITLILIILSGLILSYAQQAINGSRYILGYWDASQARWTKPFTVAATQPATCAVGEVMFDSDATAGQNIYLCTATDTWTQVTTGSSGDMTKAEYDTDADGTVDLAEAVVGGVLSPAGSAGDVQYNADGTALGGETAFSYNPATNVLTLGKVLVDDDCTLGAVTLTAAGTLCWGGASGLLASDGSNWYTANWSQNATGEVWYSGSNYEPISASGFSYATNILTVPTVKPTTSIRGTVANVINLDPDSDGTMEVNFDASGNFSGQAATALALSADGTNCSAGQAPLGVDAAGNVQSCFTPGGTPPNLWATFDTASGTDITADNTADTVVLAAGTGISITGDGTNTVTITNTALPSGAQDVWTTIDVDGTGDMTPDSTGDTLTITAGTGITISGTAASDTITITNSSPASAVTQVDIDGDGTREVTLSGSALQFDPEEDGTANGEILGDGSGNLIIRDLASRSGVGFRFYYDGEGGSILPVGNNSPSLGTQASPFSSFVASAVTVGGVSDYCTIGSGLSCYGASDYYMRADDKPIYVMADTDNDGTGEGIKFDATGDSNYELQLNVTASTISFDPDSDGTVESTINSAGAYTGSAASLTTNPTDCGANTWATTIATTGNLTCSAISGGAGITDGTILMADLTWNSTAARSAGQVLTVGTDTTKFSTATLTDTGDELTVDGTATATPNLSDAGDINFAYSSPNITGTIQAESVQQTDLDWDNTTARTDGQCVQIGASSTTFKTAACGGTVTQRLTKSVEVPTGTENLSLGYFTTGVTIDRVTCSVLGGTSVTIQIWNDAARNGTPGAGMMTGTLACDTGIGETTTSFADSTIANTSWLWFTSTGISGSPSELAITVEYH